MRLLSVVLLLVLSACATHPGKVDHVRFASDAQRVLATTHEGTVRGVEGAGVRAFLGVPFAAPPVGERRWRAPAPMAPWQGVRDATRLGSDCTQALGRKAVLGGGGGLVVGAEDCLYLNIYAPALNQENGASGPRPVMVYLHGGAFTIGSGANYDPSRLAREQDRVVVTVNSRLGALGWLAHPGFEADGDGRGGNWGLMDQQAALRWIQKNVAAFGGDPGDVTLFAESSGAWSACSLMAAPSSEGLWSRIILQSGPCLEPSSVNAVDAAVLAGPSFGAAMGCEGEGDAAVACLRATPAWRISRAPSTRSGLNGPGSWGPVYGDEIVPLSPPEAFATGAFVKTPVIIGSNADEGRLFAVEVKDMHRYNDETHWMYGAHGAEVVARYPVGPDGPGLTMARSFTDQRFSCPAQAMRRLLSRHVPVHGYEFVDQDAPMVVPSWLLPYEMGAFHASELAYIFGTKWVFADPGKFTPRQRALSERMMALWAGFGHDPDFDSVWPRSDASGGPIRIFDPVGDSMDDGFGVRHQCAFWDATPFGAVEPD